MAPKALPITEDGIKPRRLFPEAVTSGDEINPRRAVEATFVQAPDKRLQAIVDTAQ